jgi:hypothetical protein
MKSDKQGIMNCGRCSVKVPILLSVFFLIETMWN